jgi:hypothetical protein
MYETQILLFAFRDVYAIHSLNDMGGLSPSNQLMYLSKTLINLRLLQNSFL